MNTMANPYVGPRPFERNREDSARFFGRSRETQDIVSLIISQQITLLYAQSGAGKSSIINASIIPELEEKGFEVLPPTRVGGVLPEGIDHQETKNLYMFNALLKTDYQSDPRTLLSKSLSDFLNMSDQPVDKNIQPHPRAIIFDQIEELFTYTPENWREQREDFFNQLAQALLDHPLLSIVLVMREDFIANLDPYTHLLPGGLRVRYRLERLGEKAALHAIKGPLANTNRTFAPGVAEALVKELLIIRSVDTTGRMMEIEGPDVEPVQLQVVCVTLWSDLPPEVTEIQERHLKVFDVNSALSNFYESTIKSAAHQTDVSERDIRNWFQETLITPAGTRSTVFRGKDSTGGIQNSVVDFLESRHIIRAEIRAGARWYELTHDRLVEPILASNNLWLKVHQSPLQRQAALWVEQGRSDSWLLTGQGLSEIEIWSQEHQDEPKFNSTERDFLEASRLAQMRQQRDKRRRLMVTILLLFQTIIIFVLGFIILTRVSFGAIVITLVFVVSSFIIGYFIGRTNIN